MMSLIGDWWYAIKVCKKYGITWNPFHYLDNAEFVFSYGKCSTQSTVYINPFYSGFLDSFMHEIGHLLWYHKLYSKSINIKEFEDSVNQYDILTKEFVAWRFAKLSRNNSFNSDRARLFFSSYFKAQARKYGAIKAADIYHKYDMRIKK